MNSDRVRQLKAQWKSTPSREAQHAGNHSAVLPEQLDALARMAQQEVVPRLEAIVQAMLDGGSVIKVRRQDTRDSASVVLIELVFGRKEGPKGAWSAYLVVVELDPLRKEVCVQAGRNLHMNRIIPFGTRDWDIKLIDAFEWLLSDSMRPNLRITN